MNGKDHMALSGGLFETGSAWSSFEEHRKKECILQVAASLFARKGFAGTSVREIVEAAGVTKPTLYYYFKNKEDLYIQLMDMALDIFAEAIDQSLTAPGSMRQKLFNMFTSIHQLWRTNVDLLRLVNLMIYGPPGSAPDYNLLSRHSHLEEALHAVLQAGVEAGELREDRRPEAMTLLMGILRSLQVRLVMSQLHKPLAPDDIARLIDTVFDGAKPVQK